jgi:hypothetical protein
VDKKLLAVMGGGLLVGGGVFGWYVLYGDRMVARDAARKPIETWEASWQHTRRCLLGDHPSYADVGDDLAVRAFEGKLHACSLDGVGPPDMPGTGIDEIEDAWEQVRSGWHDLAIAQPYADRDAGPVRVLDAAEARLREGAGLDPLPAGPTGKIADLVLAPGGVKVESIERMTARAHALSGGGNPGWVTAHSATDAVIMPPSEAEPGWPDPSWGAMTLEPDPPKTPTADDATDDANAPPPIVTVTSGPLANGQLHDGVVVTKGPYLNVAAAVGSGANRALVLRIAARSIEGGVAIVTTTDGGAHWSKPLPLPEMFIPVPWRWPGDPPRFVYGKDEGDIGLATIDEHGERIIMPVEPGIGGAHVCTVGAATWYVTPEVSAVGRAEPGAPPVPSVAVADGAVPIACTADAVALRTNDSIYRCTRTACDKGMTVPGDSEGFADVFDGGGVVFAAQHDRLVGAWRNGVDPVYVRAPAGATLVGVAVWGKTPTFAFQTDAGLRFAPLP